MPSSWRTAKPLNTIGGPRQSGLSGHYIFHLSKKESESCMFIIISKKSLTLFPEAVAKKMDEAAGPFIKDGLIGVDHEE